MNELKNSSEKVRKEKRWVKGGIPMFECHYTRQRVTVKVHTTSIKYNTNCEKVLFNIKLFVIAARGLVLTARLKLHGMKIVFFFSRIPSHSFSLALSLFHTLRSSHFIVIEITHVQNANIAIIHNRTD